CLTLFPVFPVSSVLLCYVMSRSCLLSRLLACFLSAKILMPLVIFGGLLINLSDIPTYLAWFSVFSFIQYGKE
ncbi:unnamed protein product, partial [Hapterophycus canaliculatus]